MCETWHSCDTSVHEAFLDLELQSRIFKIAHEVLRWDVYLSPSPEISHLVASWKMLSVCMPPPRPLCTGGGEAHVGIAGTQRHQVLRNQFTCRPQCSLEEAGRRPWTGRALLFHSNLMPPGNSHKSKKFSQKLVTSGVSNIPWTTENPYNNVLQ